jgi:predicted AlkP superfamily phosphohydrolase/phosphomutase
MRVLALGLDGADHELVTRLLSEGRLPTVGRLAQEGSFGPLRSTVPAFTPTAWSSLLTGLNPGRHGIFNFSTNPNRGRARLESAASRAGAPLWRTLGRAGLRSAFLFVPFTYPPEALQGIVVTGYGGPERPEILPRSARERILAAHPGLVTAHHPMRERWWEDFEGYTGKLLRHVDEVADVCKLAIELEPELSVLCVDFMSSDHAGHLAFDRLDVEHPAHDPARAGDELVQVYEAVDRACGEIIEAARDRFGEEPTVLLLSDHGMKPIHWMFHLNRWLEENGHLRYRRRSLQPLKGGRLDYAAKVDQRLARTRRRYAGAVDRLPLLPRPRFERAFADIDFGATRAYGFASGGQLYLGEASGALRDPRYLERLAGELADVNHPSTGQPAFSVRRKEELYHGPFLHKAPELVLLPRDERISIDASRRGWTDAFERHERLDPQIGYGYSGHHAVTGILAAAGPGIAFGTAPENAEITQVPATICRLLGIELDGVDGAPIEEILADGTGGGTRRMAAAEPQADTEATVYSAEEEALILERLRDLGYE